MTIYGEPAMTGLFFNSAEPVH